VQRLVIGVPLPSLSYLPAHVAWKRGFFEEEGLAVEFPQVEIRQAALASRPGEGTFAHFRERPGYSHLVDHADRAPAAAPEFLTVPVDSLDGALPDGYVPTLVKVDVEGAELEVLKGAQETLARHRPIVVFEHGAGRPEVSKELFDLLSEGAGLRLYDIDGNGPMPRQRFLDVLAGLEIWNFVARR